MLDEYLKFSSDGSKVYFCIGKQNHQDFSQLNRTDIEEWLEKKQAKDFFLFDSNITSLLYDLAGLEASKKLIIAEKRDASLTAYTSDDKMEGFLHFKGPNGGKAVDGNAILASLKAAGIVRGIRKKTLQNIYARAIKLQAGEDFEAKVAFGQAASNGENAKLEYLIEDNRNRVLQPQERMDGTVDMRDLGKMIMVKPNQPLAKLVQAKPGLDGFTVTGEILPSKQGENLHIQQYSGSVIDENDAQLILAQIPGLATLHHDGVQVDNALTLDSVSVATGHVNFSGSVIINRDVEAGMKLEATGSIIIGGSIESATVIAGGDLIVNTGILGRQPDEEEHLSCCVNARGDVITKFAQYAQIKSEGSITISNNASHCHTLAKGDLIVCDSKERNGVLNGGHHIAYGKVKVVTMGTTSESLTQVEACALIHEIQSDIKINYHKLNDALENLKNIKNLGMEMLKLPIEQRPTGLATKLLKDKAQHSNQTKKLKASIKMLQNKIEESIKINDIKILKSCHRGLHCKFGDLQLYQSHHYNACRFFSDLEKIHIEAL